MFNVFAVRKNIRAIYTYAKLAYVVSGIRACYQFDPRFKQSISELKDGSEIILTMFPAPHCIYAIKTPRGLECKLSRDGFTKDGAYVAFKSFETARPVIDNKISFSNAFNQNRYIIQGDIAIGMHMVKLLDMAQATLTTKRKRRLYLQEKPYSSEVEFKVKMTAWCKGWR